MDCHYPNCRGFVGHLNRRFVVVLDGDGGFSGGNAATSYAIQYISNPLNPKPALMALFGVCWGNPNYVNVGDVLVATTVISINRSIARESSTDINPKYFVSSLQLPKFQSLPDKLKPEATVITLEQLIENVATRDAYLKQFPTAMGGEMEAFALVPLCDTQRIPWVIVKGVSDLASQDICREFQFAIAKQASEVLGELTAAQISDPMETPTDTNSIQRMDLVYELAGSEICIQRTELDENNLKLSLQKYFPRVRSCINFYTSVVAIHEDLSLQVTQTLLEVALNAFLHGGAKKVRMRLEFNRIDYVDDANEFDIEKLDTVERPRGGAITWGKLKNHQITQSRIVYKSMGARNQWTNHYCFEIPGACKRVFDVRANCKADLNLHTPKSSPQSVITFHDSCEVIYIDLAPIELISVALDICDELKPLLSAGKHIQIHTPDADLADKIKSTFSTEVESGKIELLPYAIQ